MSLLGRGYVEIVERKGIGHPDTLCDALAEKISAAYSCYTQDQFGVILRHMIDKFAVQGGKSHVEWGRGYMEEPIKFFLNGRFTRECEGVEIPYFDIASNAIHSYMYTLFPDLKNEPAMIEIIDNTHLSQGPGTVYGKDGKTRNKLRKDFFSASASLTKQSNAMRANDTSTTVAHYPLTYLEQLALKIEGQLNSPKFKIKHPYIGSDIKVMLRRYMECVDATLCVPMIAKYTPNPDKYRQYCDEVIELVKRMIAADGFRVGNVNLNTRDDLAKDEAYLTVIGSAVESGDEGAVGRGNRHNGVISFTQSMSLEACCGKNPVYHTGKIYTVAAKEIAKKSYRVLGIPTAVYLGSRIGDNLAEPWICRATPRYECQSFSQAQMHVVDSIAEEVLNDLPGLTQKIIHGQVKLY